MKKSDIKNLLKSFSYAWRGIMFCIKNERNMRIHISMVVLVSYFSYFYKVTKTELISIVFCFGLVILCEAVNTAIEALVNMSAPQYNNYARISKDVAAGAVLAAAIVSLVIGVIVFSDLTRLLSAVLAIFTNVIPCAIIIVLIVVSVVFVFNGPRMFGEKTTRIYHIRNH